MKFSFTKEELDSAYERVSKLPKEDIDAINMVLWHSFRIGRLMDTVSDINRALGYWRLVYKYKENNNSVCEVPPILPRRSGRYPWGQSVNDEDPNKEAKKDE